MIREFEIERFPNSPGIVRFESYFFLDLDEDDVVFRRDVPFFPRLEVERLRDELVLLFFFAAPFLPPPLSLLTVAQVRRSASPLLTPRRLYPRSMCSASRFCFEV
jgi:hypothetical protein